MIIFVYDNTYKSLCQVNLNKEHIYIVEENNLVTAMLSSIINHMLSLNNGENMTGVTPNEFEHESSLLK